MDLKQNFKTSIEISKFLIRLIFKDSLMINLCLSQFQLSFNSLLLLQISQNFRQMPNTPKYPQIPNSKHPKQSSSRQRNSHYDDSLLQNNYQSGEPSHSDYQLVIQFQLRRQRQKNRILEERLHNKEIFIQQMKEYQQQLTLAFEKCQQELVVVRKSAENFIRAERDYLEEIADLKHLIIRLEDEINFQEKQLTKKHYNSVKKESSPSPTKQRQKRSKTLMENNESPKLNFQSSIEKELIEESTKISKFLTQFLMMTECFQKEAKLGSLKHRLKIAWKWIKNVVKQWNQGRAETQLLQQFLSQIEHRLKSKNKNFQLKQTKAQSYQAIIKALR